MNNCTQKFDVDTASKAVLLSQGHDLDALYKKYAGGNAGLEYNGTINASMETPTNSESFANSKLDKLYICQFCHGHGIGKVVYNHFVRDENCSDCNSKGILDKSEGNTSSPPQPL